MERVNHAIEAIIMVSQHCAGHRQHGAEDTADEDEDQMDPAFKERLQQRMEEVRRRVATAPRRVQGQRGRPRRRPHPERQPPRDQRENAHPG